MFPTLKPKPKLFPDSVAFILHSLASIAVIVCTQTNNNILDATLGALLIACLSLFIDRIQTIPYIHEEEGPTHFQNVIQTPTQF